MSSGEADYVNGPTQQTNTQNNTAKCSSDAAQTSRQMQSRTETANCSRVQSRIAKSATAAQVHNCSTATGYKTQGCVQLHATQRSNAYSQPKFSLQHTHRHHKSALQQMQMSNAAQPGAKPDAVQQSRVCSPALQCIVQPAAQPDAVEHWKSNTAHNAAPVQLHYNQNPSLHQRTPAVAPLCQQLQPQLKPSATDLCCSNGPLQQPTSASTTSTSHSSRSLLSGAQRLSGRQQENSLNGYIWQKSTCSPTALSPVDRTPWSSQQLVSNGCFTVNKCV